MARKWPEGKSETRGSRRKKKIKQGRGEFHGLLTAERNSKRGDAALPAGTRRALTRLRVNANFLTGVGESAWSSRQPVVVPRFAVGSVSSARSVAAPHGRSCTRCGGVIYVVSKGSMKRQLYHTDAYTPVCTDNFSHRFFNYRAVLLAHGFLMLCR